MAGRHNGDREAGIAPRLITVRGARVHNLRDLDVEIPRDRFVVLTGLSGSGKSSLAFDTLYAEGQRRYLEGLSSYARQFVDQLERPDVDLIEGLPPTIAIDQHAGPGNPRSTVATLTEIHDYLRLLYARTGLPHCPACGREIRRQTPEQITAGVLGMQEGRKVLILAPLVRGRKGQHAEAVQAIRRAGLLRARIDGQIVEIAAEPKLAKTKTHDIEAVVDRLVVREGIRPRLAESIDLALKLGQGSVLLSAQTETGWEDRLLSVNFACPACGAGFEEVEPRTFSFNSPYGACPTCNGLGTVTHFDPELIIPDQTLGLAEGAVVPWRDPKPVVAPGPALAALLKKKRLTAQKPLAAWPEAALESLLRGDPATGFEGIIPTLERELAAARTDRRRAALERFRTAVPCPACGGTRLRGEARAVTIAGRGIHEVAALTIVAARPWFESLRYEPPQDLVGPPLVREVVTRLAFLERVGLGYLTLDRGTDTLSGGELQRVRLASQIGSGLVGVCYILDEPTAGLHPRDTERLLACLNELRDQGSSVVVVEHDETTIRAADWMIDLGPGAGPDGGRIVASGPPATPVEEGESSTVRYLRHEERITMPVSGRLARSPGTIVVRGAAARNLKEIDAVFPLGTLTCVTGVSGSGKSTLVHEILAPAVRRRLERLGPPPGACRAVEGLDALDALVEVDQTPIGRSPRSTPATYTGVFDEIRKVFARTREAKLRGYGPSRFSFNVKGGRCETCEGQGMRRIEMNFLPDLYVRCEACGGQRFNRQTLEIRFKGRSIGDVLALRVVETLAFFDAQPRVHRGLEALNEAGLGYMTLGQSSTTLSGGEAQRVKLAAELGRCSGGRTLYILDEPTVGLHFADVARLLAVLHRLSDAGNTVVVIEHNLDVIKTADWVIDLGPEGGDAGGRLVVAGTPQEVAQAAESQTGRFLRPLLDV
jgi:excinuclease ABC subunit A